MHTITQDEQGSIWRQWDLHFHTPSSYDYQGGPVTNEEIIEKLLSNNIKVIAITDHHLIDVERIRELQRIGAGRITILPGIEFLSDAKGKEPVHFIGIFSENSDIEYVWDQIRNKTNIHKIKKEGKKPNEIYCDLLDTVSIVKENDGIVSIHAGDKSNSLENITNALPQGIAQKEDIAKVIDIFELGKENDVKDYRKMVLPFLEKKINKKFPLIICSDNHDINKYHLKSKLWIKGDPNFLGLKQVINQPNRAYIGNKPEGIEVVENNLTKFIERISISKKENSVLEERWFNNFNIKLNSGLVAIIGNKGNGKSALTDIIGLCGNTHNYQGFSFLHEDKFLRKKERKSDHFDAVLTWKNGKETTLCLSEKPDKNQEERVKYIPQSYLENLCVSIDSKDFERELRNIIFSHIPKDQRLGKNSLDELIGHRTQIIRDDIEITKGRLSIVNSEIILLEEKQNPLFAEKIQKSLELKIEEQDAHFSVKPSYQDPVESNIDKSEEVDTRIQLLRAENDRINETVRDVSIRTGSLRKDVEILSQRKQSIESLKARLDMYVQESRDILDDYDIDTKLIINYSINTNVISDRIKFIDDEIFVLENSILPDGALLSRHVEIVSELTDLQSQLDEPSRMYQQYLTNLENWEKINSDIIGDVDSEGSIENLRSVISYLNNQLEIDIKEKFKQRKELVKSIFNKKNSILSIYKEMYDSVMNFILNHGEVMNSYKITFDTLFKEDGLFSKFEGFINFTSKGTYQGAGNGISKLKESFDRYDFHSDEESYKFVFEVIDNIKYDRRNGNNTFMGIKNQLKSSGNPLDFYNYICGLDYLTPVYDLKLSNKNVTSLSPGERGALLLIFYLVLDNNNIPLIIDQPEENLDNQSVYNILVPFISMAKQYRQVIIVTHNPNLAVVCDADQIIYIRIDKENGNEIFVESGSLENPIISNKILEILEGTLPAFSMRTSTYKLSALA